MTRKRKGSFCTGCGTYLGSRPGFDRRCDDCSSKHHAMSIEGVELGEHHKGSKVTYVPMHADGPQHPDAEGGTIKSWNDKFVFVNYGYNTKGTRPEDLKWG